ncbi:MAG: thioredoxin domain-containing protein [Phycisphaerae bacterium]|nr:thioredoxin domain-containing protein [Phycisphaerae bacterium]
MRESADASASDAPKQAEPARTNGLAGESSPYLLQHAHNPVDWYPWREEALGRARRENKPIFMSIGYAACHWCHVMERESFEDADVAEVLNAHFISIKVDREERPDLDEIYMTAVQLMTGSGGWPLNVFLTPDLKPFYGGTYFPPDDRYGLPGFGKVLEHIARTWREDPDAVQRSAEELTRAIRDAVGRDTVPAGTIDAAILARAAQELERAFDSQWGGFGQAPKFPPSGAIGVLLRQHAHMGDEKWLEIATTTLDRMAQGGMYDQLGGGFHRYSTDRRWLVPHFEKMLYDNALLARVYLEAWQATGKDLYRRVATEVFDYVLRDMTDRRGGFHSSEDADSEGQEGKFYVWTPDEIKAVLGKEDGAFFCGYYGVTVAGNFEGHSILHVPQEASEFAREKGLSPEELEDRMTPLRRKLREAREARVRPGKDDKVIAAWNGMMISALSRGYQVLGEERFLKAAEKAANFALTEMVRDGTLLRTYRGKGDGGDEGVRSPKATCGTGVSPVATPAGRRCHSMTLLGGLSRLPAYLDDYAEMAGALTDLYEATFDLRWLEAADRLAGRMVADFWDEENGGFFYTSASHKNLLARTKPYYDGAVPSGNSTATLVLLRLSEFLDNAEYRKKAEAVLASAASLIRAQPRGYLNLLWAADFAAHPVRQIAIAGRPGERDTQHLLDVIHGRYIPNKIVALVEPGAPGSAGVEERIPLLRHKAMIDNKTTVYVCRNHHCEMPVTDEAELTKILDEAGASPNTTDGQTTPGGSGTRRE